MKKKTVHTDRINFAVSPKLKKNIEVAAHANLQSVSSYLRGLVYEDMSKHYKFDDDMSNYPEADAFYVVKHKLL